MYIVIIISSLILFMILQYIDDQKNQRNGKPLTSTGSKLTMLFFITIIITILMHFFWKESKDSVFSGGNQDISVKNTYLSKIDQEIDIGLPDF